MRITNEYFTPYISPSHLRFLRQDIIICATLRASAFVRASFTHLHVEALYATDEDPISSCAYSANIIVEESDSATALMSVLEMIRLKVKQHYGV